MAKKTKSIAKKHHEWSRTSAFEKSMIIGIPLVVLTALTIRRVKTGRWIGRAS